MKSKWLPTFPLHAANWLADPRVQMLDPVAKSELLEALLRSWMLGRAISVGGTIAEAYAELWPEYEVVLHEHNALREKRAEQGRKGNEKRWGSPTGSPEDRNSDPLAIAGGSQVGSPEDRTPTPTITQTITTTPTTTPTVVGRRGTRLPDDAVLTDEWRKVAADEGVPASEVETLFREFVGYWTALPGQKATKLDWLATWRNRCIAKAPIYRRSPSPQPDPSRRNSFVPEPARQNIPTADETRARIRAEDEERRRQELRAQLRSVS